MRILTTFILAGAALSLMSQDIQVMQLDPDTIYGNAGEEALIVHFELYNPGPESVLVEVVKTQVETPDDWEVSICTAACLPPEQDTALASVGAGLSESISLYFFTITSGIGQAELEIYVEESASLIGSYPLTAIALPTQLEESEVILSRVAVQDDAILFDELEGASIRVWDLQGRSVAAKTLTEPLEMISLSEQAAGIYVLDIVDVMGANGQLKFLKTK